MKVLLSLVFLALVVPSLYSIDHPKTATEFWLCFDQNYRNVDTNVYKGHDNDANLTLSMMAESDATVQVDIDALNFHRTEKLSALQRLSTVIPAEAMIVKPGLNSKASIHIVSSVPLTVIGLNHRYQTTDSYAALGLNRLGTEYMLSTYTKLSEELLSQASIIASEDNTTLEINVTQNCKDGIDAGKVNTIHLNRGDVFHLIGDYHRSQTADITGSRIHSDKPVAVFSGHVCAYVPVGSQGCNVLVEQLAPINDWGKSYYAVQLPQRSRYSLRVVAAEDNTEIMYRWGDGELRSTLKAGEYKDIESLKGAVVLQSTKPIMVMQFSHGYRSGDNIGDPCMILLRPLEKYQTRFTTIQPDFHSSAIVSTSVGSGSVWKHYALIVVPTAAISSLRIDAKPVNPTDFILIDARMSVGSILLNPDTPASRVTCDQPISVVQYGIGFNADAYDSYGHGW